MVENIIIESNQNKIVKQINALKNKKDRDKSGLFIIEGERLANEIPEDWEVLYYAVSTKYENEMVISKIKSRSEVYFIEEKLFNKISDTINPQGIISVVKQKKAAIENCFKKNSSPFLVMLENVTDPGNMGTIIRTADAAGCDGVIMSKGCVDLYNPKVIRATMGSVFHLPIITGADFEEVCGILKKNNIKTVATHLKGDKSIFETDLSCGCAIVVGNEANGISEQMRDNSDELIKIPMKGNAESMNASVAAAIAIYEVLRQRL